MYTEMHAPTNTRLIEIFKTECGSVYQCDQSNHFVLEYAGRFTAFKPTNFIDFTKRVFAINLHNMASNIERHADIAILMPQYTETCFLLTMHDTICLQRILGGAKAVLQLHTLLRTSQLQFA